MSNSHINFSNYMNKDCTRSNTQNGGVILSYSDVNGLDVQTGAQERNETN